MMTPDERAQLEQLMGCVIDSDRLLYGKKQLGSAWRGQWNSVDVAFKITAAKEDALRGIRAILDRHTEWVVPS